jgi:hypothetical protein
MDQQTEGFGPYRQEGAAVLIELSLHRVSQLFNSLDPSPFLEKDLDDDAEAYIVGAAREIGRDLPLKIVLHLPANEVAQQSQADVAAAVQHYFAYRLAATRRDLRQYLRVGRTSLAIGLAFLVACFSLREVVQGLFGDGTVAEILSEGLIIMGWVAMWRPIQVFLYDWWPIRRTVRVFAKLAAAPVELRALP